MQSFTIRQATLDDAPALLRIYAPYITDTTVTFEYEVPSLQAFRQRIETISAEYPYLLCERDGVILAYAYAHRAMERAAYQWNAELSVYVHREHLREGLGSALYRCLLELLELQHVQNAYGVISIPNDSSCRLHEALGFRVLGVYRQTGYKLGEWHDVVWYEKSLGAHEVPPRPLLSVKSIDPATLKDILRRNSRWDQTDS